MQLMPEDQNIEWKENWRDDYLKWICGFANAQGGRIFIGLDDSGNVVGVADYARLLEDIPNKILQTLGILADVDLHEASGRYYIEIIVAPSSVPINYRGEYHYRCGSTKQVLKGNALNEFLLQKSGLKWDGLITDSFSIDDLDRESFDIFRREALRCRRISEEDVTMSHAQLLDQLGLISGGKLKNAAVLLFHRKPEKLIAGCYVKIGRFTNESELLYHDVVSGSLFLIADRVIDLLYAKYLTASISYERDVRVERYPYPRPAIREAVLNAIVHCNWRDNVPIQIRVDDNSLSISNSCILPLGWTVETLTKRHRSRPFNPCIANAFFRAGYIESWGRGIARLYQYCSQYGVPAPQYELLGEDITVVFSSVQNRDASSGETEATLPNIPAAELSAVEMKLVSEIKKNNIISQTALAEKLKISRRTVQRLKKQLISKGVLLDSMKKEWIFLFNPEILAERVREKD